MNSDGNKWYLLLNKKSFQQNYLSIMFLIIVWIMYSLNKIIGLFVTLIAFFSILYLDYHWTVILKVAVIILTSAILFLTTTKMMGSLAQRARGRREERGGRERRQGKKKP